MKNNPTELIRIGLRVSQEGIGRYAALTHDYNPIHVDPEFAAKTEMGSVIAHGTMSLNLIWQALCATLGREEVAALELDVRFRRPVRIDDTLVAGGERSADSEVYNVWVRNQDDQAVIEGTTRSLGS